MICISVANLERTDVRGSDAADGLGVNRSTAVTGLASIVISSEMILCVCSKSETQRVNEKEAL